MSSEVIAEEQFWYTLTTLLMVGTNFSDFVTSLYY